MLLVSARGSPAPSGSLLAFGPWLLWACLPPAGSRQSPPWRGRGQGFAGESATLGSCWPPPVVQERK